MDGRTQPFGHPASADDEFPSPKPDFPQKASMRPTNRAGNVRFRERQTAGRHSPGMPWGAGGLTVPDFPLGRPARSEVLCDGRASARLYIVPERDFADGVRRISVRNCSDDFPQGGFELDLFLPCPAGFDIKPRNVAVKLSGAAEHDLPCFVI